MLLLTSKVKIKKKAILKKSTLIKKSILAIKAKKIISALIIISLAKSKYYLISSNKIISKALHSNIVVL